MRNSFKALLFYLMTGFMLVCMKQAGAQNSCSALSASEVQVFLDGAWQGDRVKFTWTSSVSSLVTVCIQDQIKILSLYDPTTKQVIVPKQGQFSALNEVTLTQTAPALNGESRSLIFGDNLIVSAYWICESTNGYNAERLLCVKYVHRPRVSVGYGNTSAVNASGLLYYAPGGPCLYRW